MLLLFAGDHAGFEMKQKLLEFVQGLGHDTEDLGPFSYNTEDDYPDYVVPLARRIAKAQMDADIEDADGRRLKPRMDADGKYLRASASYQRESAVRGIVVAGSGQGEMIAINRVKGARAALFCPCTGTQMDADKKGGADERGCSVGLELIKASREHNDSNIFCIGARFCTLEEAKKGITVWLETPFSGDERHIRRLKKIENLTGGA